MRVYLKVGGGAWRVVVPDAGAFVCGRRDLNVRATVGQNHPPTVNFNYWDDS